MARTKHQIVQKVAAYKIGKRRGAKNSRLKQAAHQGRAPVSNPRTAQPGFAAVPVSTVALPPGEGPPMSSTPIPAGRGRRVTQNKPTSISPILTSSSGVAPISSGSGAKSRGRGRRKRSTSK